MANSLRFTIGWNTTGLAAGLVISQVFAQDDVVITATRFEDSKRNLPVGVTLITREDIENSASTNLRPIPAPRCSALTCTECSTVCR